VDVCTILEMRPSDWPCSVPAGRTIALYLLASALVSLAVLVPAIVLARAGRRLLAFAPLVAPAAVVLLSDLASWAWSGIWVTPGRSSESAIFLGPWASGAFPGEPPPGPWRPDDPLAIAVDLALLAAPLAAYLILFRPARAERWTLGPRAALLAFGIGVGASFAIEMAVHRVTHAGVYLDGGWFFQGLLMVGLGLLLPLGPRRSIWAIPVVAVLASLGPATAFDGAIFDLTVFAWFRSALPLALMGFAAAGAVSLVARRRGTPVERPDVAPRFRPVSVTYGLGGAALALSVVMAAFDPLPIEIATPLPTYLGARVRVDDLRARMTIDEGLDAALAYRDDHGSFDGFDARAAGLVGPTLLWDDGLPPEEATFGPDLVVRVLEADRDRLRLLVVGQGTAYCLAAAEGRTTYGAGTEGRVIVRARAAIAACGERSWTDELLRPFPVEGLCVGVEDPSIATCRAVQRLLRRTLASPTGNAY
jgi:hypothetical protein